MDKTDSDKKPGLKQRIKNAFNGVSRKDVPGVLKHTLQDLSKLKEIALLVASSFVPGGWIGYGAYRVAKYKRRHPPANDDKAAAAVTRAPKPAAPKP